MSTPARPVSVKCELNVVVAFDVAEDVIGDSTAGGRRCAIATGFEYTRCCPWTIVSFGAVYVPFGFLTGYIDGCPIAFVTMPLSLLLPSMRSLFSRESPIDVLMRNFGVGS